MTTAGRGRAAGAALLVLALAGACSSAGVTVLPGVPAAARTPAPVRASWPGCAAVGAFGDDEPRAPSGVGGVPAGFTATRVVLCEAGERQDAAGDTVAVDLERTAADVGPLLTYLAQPDERPSSGACTADGWLPPALFLVDDAGRYVAPTIPVDGCGKPRGWADRDHRGLAWTLPAYTDRVVGRGEVTESAAAKRAGCAMGWKDAVDAYATSSHRRHGGFGDDLPARTPLRVCVFAVPAADQGTDAPPGDFVSGRTLEAGDRAAFVGALRSAPSAPARCTTANARFATVTPGTGGPTVYVELDGCRRAVTDGETTPVVRVGDDLVALLEA